MTVLCPTDHVEHRLPGVTFAAFVNPGRGSRQLCGWRTELDPETEGSAHTVSHEEILLVLAGEPELTLDGQRSRLRPGSVVFVPTGGTLALSNPGSEPATLWVSTSVGLEATMASGETIRPPWAN